jgi:SRSO17 transposase
MTAPAQVDAKRQSLLHGVGQAKWSDIDVLNQVRGLVQPLVEQHGPIAAWIIDDSGLPKQGKQSVGVARQ